MQRVKQNKFFVIMFRTAVYLFSILLFTSYNKTKVSSNKYNWVFLEKEIRRNIILYDLVSKFQSDSINTIRKIKRPDRKEIFTMGCTDELIIHFDTTIDYDIINKKYRIVKWIWNRGTVVERVKNGHGWLIHGHPNDLYKTSGLLLLDSVNRVYFIAGSGLFLDDLREDFLTKNDMDDYRKLISLRFDNYRPSKIKILNKKLGLYSFYSNENGFPYKVKINKVGFEYTFDIKMNIHDH